jgi:hypothetical protein
LTSFTEFVILRLKNRLSPVFKKFPDIQVAGSNALRLRSVLLVMKCGNYREMRDVSIFRFVLSVIRMGES